MISSYVKNTGFRSDFCSRCGSPVPNQVRETDKVWIPAGLLEETAGMRVVAHLHVASAAAWDCWPEGALVYDEAPQMEEFLAALWHRTSGRTQT